MDAVPDRSEPAAGRVWLGTSWKMTKTLGEARAFIDVLARTRFPDVVQPFVLPAHTALAAARDRLPEESPVLLGAQDAHWGPEGAGTGEVSMRMVADAGAGMVEIGHSERREHHHETDEMIGWKVRAALDASLVPLVCVGEPESVRSAGDESAFVGEQVTAALRLVRPSEVPAVLIAYEPVWAIGERGRPARPSDVASVIEHIRGTVRRAQGGRCAAVLYGGSVDPGNAPALLGQAGADGLFVGRAAWDVSGFLRLVDVVAAFAATSRQRATSR